MHTKRVYSSFDYVLAALTVLISAFGIIVLASATGSNKGALSRELTSQMMWVATGIIIMLVVAFVDYKFICKFYIPIYLVNIFLLIAVLIYGMATRRETYRWLGIGSFGILPSEFSKIFMIIFLASLLERLGENVSKFRYFCLVIGLTLVPTALILVEPSLSASLVTVMICVFMLYGARLKLRYFAIGLLVLVPVIGIIYYDVNADNPLLLDKLLGYQASRLEAFYERDPSSDEYYQTYQSIQAIGTGRLTGKGLFNNEIYVPKSENDFIAAIIGSEFGFLGCMAVLAAFFLLIIKCLTTAMKSDVYSGKLISVGCAAMIGVQVFVNFGVATGLLPNTGMALPFMSAGGSSMWASFASVGLVINVGMTKSKLMFEE